MAPDARPVVLSADPAATRALHGVDALPRSPAAVWRALRGARLLVSGGGSLVQDVTSARSAVYYLGTMLAAAARGVPVAVVGQGIGPLRRPWVRRLARVAYERTAAVSVRDAASAALLQALGVSGDVHLGADLALLAPSAAAERARALVQAAGLDPARPLLAVAPRSWPGLLDAAALGRVAGTVARARGLQVMALPFDRVRDAAVAAAVARAAGGRVVAVERPDEAMAVVGLAALVLAVRLHALVFAVAGGVPAVALAYDPKVAAFAAEAGLASVRQAAAAAEVEAALAAAWDAREATRAALAAAVPRLRARARAGVECLGRLLEDSAARGVGAGVPKD